MDLDSKYNLKEGISYATYNVFHGKDLLEKVIA